MNWKHSFYGITAITLGQAFSIDEAYRLLKELQEDRLFSIASSFAESKRAQAKVIDAKASIRDYGMQQESQANMRRSEAFILETDARFIIAQPCLDMAYGELAFIAHLIKHIEDNDLLIHSDFTIGSQLIQPMEIAYEYIWAVAYDGLHSQLARNVYAHPMADIILDIARNPEIAKDPRLASRVHLTKALADRLNLADSQLAITVNSLSMIEQVARLELKDYRKSAAASLIKLQEKALADPSGSPSESARVTSGD